MECCVLFARAHPGRRLAEALVARETLNEQEILEVTGLPPAPPLETGMLPVADTDGRSARGAS
jgi:hypothetical protein